MKKTWSYLQNTAPEAQQSLAQSLHISDTLAHILVSRGVVDFEGARDFFRPSLTHLHSPFLMKDMHKAVARLHTAIHQQEKILIYGDYDVDGTTSVALMYLFLEQFTPHIQYYIPDRHKEGYGVSRQGITYAHEQHFSLIISLDCGIKSAREVAYAHSLGIDFIICDHHLPDAEIPAAVAVLDAKQSDCDYPYKELCGCGVGFKLAQGYCLQHQLGEEYYLPFLDLVMVAIGADIVPLTGENRILAYHGLQKLNTKPILGLQALMKNAGKESNYSITDVVFLLAPRINAAGRLGDAKDAVKLLLDKEIELASDHSFAINDRNMERKEVEKIIFREALAQLQALPHSRKTTVVYAPSWHKGVVGIVASKLIEQGAYRPTVVLSLSEGKITGSARSVSGFDLYEALLPCKDLLLQFGGHKAAAGLSMLPENLPLFIQKFEESVASSISEEQLTPKVWIDADLQLSQVDGKFFRVKQQISPFGPLNMDPTFASKGVTLVGFPRVVGDNHLKISLKQDNSAIFEAIGFGLGEWAEILKPKQKFDICYHLESNTYKEHTKLQLRLLAIK